MTRLVHACHESHSRPRWRCDFCWNLAVVPERCTFLVTEVHQGNFWEIRRVSLSSQKWLYNLCGAPKVAGRIFRCCCGPRLRAPCLGNVCLFNGIPSFLNICCSGFHICSVHFLATPVFPRWRHYFFFIGQNEFGERVS